MQMIIKLLNQKLFIILTSQLKVTACQSSTLHIYIYMNIYIYIYIYICVYVTVAPHLGLAQVH